MPPELSDSEDSYFVGGGSGDDSRDASPSLADEEAPGPVRQNGGAVALPNPLEAISAVLEKPAFLDPEATRPVAAPIHRGAVKQRAQAPAGAAERRPADPGEPDISRLAPALSKKAAADEPGARRPQGAVIQGAAKRYKLDDGGEGPVYSAAQVALMGGAGPGQDEGEGDEAEEAGQRAIGPARPPPPGAARPPAGRPSRAQPVSEFLNKGLGAALLPRKKQDRKEKEKSKRALGQSSVGHWKSEAEMVLRQQYDS